MTFGEVKLDSARLFDTFGFGSTASFLLYFLLFKDIQGFNDDSLSSLQNVPTFLAVPIATSMLFFLHMFGKGLMMLGNVFSRMSDSKKIKIEIDMACIDHPYASQFLDEKKASIRFTEGLFGMCGSFFIVLGLVKLFSVAGLVKSLPNLDWVVLLFLFSVAWGTAIWIKSLYLQMELFSTSFELARLKTGLVSSETTGKGFAP